MSFSKIASELHNLNERLKKSKQVYLLVVALIIGILGGFGAVGFRELIAFFQRIAWDTDKFTQAMVSAKSVWWILLTPAIGGLIVGAIVHYFAPEARGHGVPEVMEAVALKGGRIRARVVGAKALASGICIATGGSVGREGPIVQIGSAIGSVIGQILQFGAGRMRTVVGCGAAAGIAATFNAPIAGAIFALEILVGDFAVVNFSPIVISSVSATIVSRWYFGDEAAFVDIPEYALNHPLELVTYACLGLLAGIVALIFTRTLYFSEDQFDRIKITLPLKACLGGLIIGAIAIQYPQILGVGYEAMEAALTKSILWQTLAILLVVKIVAVSITIGSGGSGGVFAPSLFIGGTLGALVGTLARSALPGITGDVGGYALVGMGAVLAAATNAPITAIIILFELTGDYRIILPLMMASIIATALASRFSKGNIYTTKLLRRGVNLRDGQDVDVLKNVKVKEVLRMDLATVEPGERLLPLLARLGRSEDSALYVVDDQKQLMGIISLHELQGVLKDIEVLKDVLIAADIAATNWPPLTSQDTLDKVLTCLDISYRDELPIVEDGKLIGRVRTEDIIGRYNHEIFQREMLKNLEAE